MGILKDKLLEPGARSSVVADCVQLVDDEVDAQKGVTGVVIKGGYKAFRKLRPGIAKEAVEFLLEDFVQILDGVYADYLKAHPDKKTPFESWSVTREKEIANAMLGVTDAIVQRSDKTVIKKIYGGLRKTAEKTVAEAVPAISRLIVKHVG